MPRPTLLVAEPEPHGALSTRKLVLETGKFNVLTAHSTGEALELVRLFPNVSAAVLVSDDHIDCDEIAAAVKNQLGNRPVVSLAARIGVRCARADHHLSSHEPEELLNLMRKLLGDPRDIDTR